MERKKLTRLITIEIESERSKKELEKILDKRLEPEEMWHNLGSLFAEMPNSLGCKVE